MAFLYMAFLPVIVTATPRAPAIDGVASFVDRFDREISLGLPATVSVQGAGEGQRHRRAAHDRFVIREALKIRVDFPDGSQGRLYRGTMNGSAAVFTRSGNHLDVSVPGNDSVAVTGFTAGQALVESAGTGRGEDGSSSPRTRRAAEDPGAVPVSVPEGHWEDPGAYGIRFFVFRHDDLRHIEPRHLHARYVAWWLDDLVAEVLPAETVRVSYYLERPWVTDMAYGETTLDDFARAMSRLSEAISGSYAKTYKHKFVLLTRDRPAPGVSGQAYEGGSVAVASLAGRLHVVAHEFGHLLGATHEDARVEARDWWWCESNMYPSTSSLRSSCLTYTTANARNIRMYVRHGSNRRGPPALLSD